MAGRTPVPAAKPGTSIPLLPPEVATPSERGLTVNLTSPTATSKVNPPPATPPASGGGAASPDGNTTPNAGPELTVDDTDRLRVGLDRDQQFFPNFLNDFHNVSYHIRFFMIDPDSSSTGLSDIGSMSFNDVAQTIDGATKVVIAETGVTAAINIKSLSFTSFAQKADQQTGLTFNMSLVEPLGTSFYDVTVNAAKLLGVTEFKQSPYFIELTFKAYGEDGTTLTNPLAGHRPMMDNGQPVPEEAMFHNNGRWLYQVFLQNVHTTVTEAGSVHELTMTYSQTGSAGQDEKEIPEAIIVSGETVGEFLKNLKDQLEEAQERRYGHKIYTYDFVFQPSPHVKSDPNTWSLLDDPHKYTDKPNLDMKVVNGKPVMQIQPAEDIESLIILLLGSTKEGQRYAINGTKAEDQIISGGPQARDQILPSVSKVVNVGKTLHDWGYEKHIIYQIRPQFHNHLVLHPQQVEEAKQPVVQQEMLSKLRQYGYFRKRFDYLYTGMNTEILNFNIDFNVPWTVVLPYVTGWQSSRNQIQIGAKYNDNAIVLNDNLQQGLQDYNAAFDAAASALRTYVKSQFPNASELDVNADGTVSGQSVTADQQAKLASLVSNKTTAAQKRAQALQSLSQSSASSEQDGSPLTMGSNTLYAEDLTDPNDPLYKTRFVQAPAGKGDSTGAGMSEPYHRDRAIFGILMEQLVGAKEMIQIEMDIRGDPYWLGIGNMENAPDPQQNPGIAPYEYAGVTFFLKVAYPFQASSLADNGEDENPNANFRQTTLSDGSTTREDAFTGFYEVIKTEHKFEDGQFTQTLTAFRNNQMVADALGYSSVEGDDLDKMIGEQEAKDDGTGDAGPTGPPIDHLPANSEAAACALYKKLSAMGYNNVQSAAIIGSWMQESSLTAAITNTKGSTIASPGAFGLAQWYGSRKNGLIAFAQQRGLNPNSPDAQLQFFQYEMATSHSTQGNQLKNASSLNDAMNAMNHYEGFNGFNGVVRPGTTDETGKRYEYAQHFLDKFNSGGCN